MGRSSKRTRTIVATILGGLRKGIPLVVLCRSPGMPSDETWRNWCRADDDLDDAYAEARMDGLGAILEGVREAVASGAAIDQRWVHEQFKLADKWSPYL